MSQELKDHIKNNPSSFNETNIGKRLIDENVSKQLYADIRDLLYNPLKRERDKVDNILKIMVDVFCAYIDRIG